MPNGSSKIVMHRTRDTSENGRDNPDEQAQYPTEEDGTPQV